MLFGIAGVSFILLSIIRRLGDWIELTGFFQRFFLFLFGSVFLFLSVLGAAENKEEGAIKRYYDKVLHTKKQEPDTLPEPPKPNPPAPTLKKDPQPPKPKRVIASEPTDEEEPKIKTPQGYFTLGSTKGEVLAVMGQPDQIIGSGTYVSWYYDLASINFEYGKVVSFNNYEGRLKIKM